MKSIWEYLKKPRIYLYILSILLLAGSLVMAFAVPVPIHVVYVFYGISLLSLCYFVYGTIFYVKHGKKTIYDFMNSHAFTRTYLESYSFKSICNSIVSLIITLGFSIYEGYYGIRYSSLWFGCLAGYHVLLLLMRTVNLFLNVRLGLVKRCDERAEGIKRGIYFSNGIFLMILSLAMLVPVYMVVYRGGGWPKTEILSIAYAAYGFYKMTMAIINLIKARKNDELSVQVIRNLNLADALLTMFALATCLLLLGDDTKDLPTWSAAIGYSVCVMVTGIGIYMITKILLLQNEKRNNVVFKENDQSQK